MASTPQWMNTMAPEDKDFYSALGLRIAQARKAKNLTQQQMAEALGISQQTMAHYEVGRLRIAVALLPAVAELLGTSIDALVHGTETKVKAKRGPDSKLQQQVEKIRQLPRAKQQFVMDMLDTVIQQSAT